MTARKRIMGLVCLMVLFCFFGLVACNNEKPEDKTNGNETAEHVHLFGEWETVTEPTCTVDGLKKHVCSDCGSEETENIPALGHNFVDDECMRCHETLRATEGLNFTFNNDTQTYSVSSYNGTSPTIIITNKYDDGINGKYSVTSIGEGAFRDCTGLTSVTIGNGVTSIGDNAFSGCDGLTRIEVAGGNTKYHSNGNCLIETGTKTLILGCKTSVIPADGSVTSIGSYAFRGCTGLTSVTIGNGVTSIGNDAFSGCSSLESITIPFVGAEAGKTSSDTWQYPFGYIFGTSGYDGGTAVTQYYYGSSTSSTTSTTYYIPSSLKSVTITGGNILYRAFDGCSGLTSVSIGNDVTSIGEDAFVGCRGLTSVTIPDSVTSIGSHAFNGCSSLESITIPFVGEKAGKTSSDTYQYPFGYIFGTNSYIGGTATKQRYCGSSTSSKTSTTYYIPSSLKSVTVTGGNILYGAFHGCAGLTSVTIGNGVTNIGSFAFSGCSKLTSITIDNSVTSIGSLAFDGCTGLTSIYYTGDIASWCGISGLYYIMSSSSTHTLYIKGNKVEKLVIPDSVTSIGGSAFHGCNGLTSVTIGNSVTSIGDYAFRGCTGLTSINVAGDNTKYHSNGNCLIETGTKTLILGCKTSVIPADGSVTSIGNYAFEDCTGLTSITIPDNVTSIGYEAFSGCAGLTSVSIPDSVTSIREEAFHNTAWYNNNPDGVVYAGKVLYKYKGTMPENTQIEIVDGTKGIAESAFKGCSGLTSITIPDSVTRIGWEMDFNYQNLTSIYYMGDIASWCGISGLRNIMSSSLSLYIGGNKIEGNLVIPYGVTSIGSGAFFFCVGLTSITIPNSVTSIGSAAFRNCTGLTSVTIGNGVTSIGNYAFIDCRGLTSVTIPTSVTSIGEGAFYGCSGLTSVTIPNSVTSIDSEAFSYCSGLTSVTIGNGVTSIGAHAFSSCRGLTSVTIPNSVTSVGSSAFAACSELTSVTIGNSVTSIDSEAFYYCRGLTSITIPDSVTSIGSGAFEGCTHLTSITIPTSVTSIGSGAFYNTAWYNNKPDGVVYAGKVLYKYKGTMSENAQIEIVDGTKGVAEYAFSGCTGLTSITIPDTVTSIREYAFSGCFKLVEVYNKSSLNVTAGSSDYGYVAYYAKNIYTEKNGSKLSTDSNGYIIYTDGEGKGLIGYTGTDTELTLSEGITEINNYAFDNCSNITSITIPDSVTSIGDRAFAYCSGLTSIDYNGTKEQWNAISKDTNWNKNTGNYTVHCTDGDIAKQ